MRFERLLAPILHRNIPPSVENTTHATGWQRIFVAIITVLVVVAVTSIGIFAAADAALCRSVRAVPVFSRDNAFMVQADSKECRLLFDSTSRIVIDERSAQDVLVADLDNATIAQGDFEISNVSIVWSETRVLTIEYRATDQSAVVRKVMHWNGVVIVHQFEH